jgi:hypothetical protein
VLFRSDQFNTHVQDNINAVAIKYDIIPPPIVEPPEDDEQTESEDDNQIESEDEYVPEVPYAFILAGKKTSKLLPDTYCGIIFFHEGQLCVTPMALLNL